MKHTTNNLVRLLMLKQTKPTLATAIGMVNAGDCEGKVGTYITALEGRGNRTLSPTGLKKGNYAVRPGFAAAVGGETIQVGWYYGKPGIKMDGVKVKSGTDQFRICWTAVTTGIATPVAPVTVEDDLLI